jgi:Arc/MetJ-type ribon-helix-helix transcriptional regulator
MMPSVTIDLPEAMKDFLDRQVRSGRCKDSSTFVQMLIAEAARNQWREEAEQKLREALAEYERGECVQLQKGDCEKMVREYLKLKTKADGKANTP